MMPNVNDNVAAPARTTVRIPDALTALAPGTHGKPAGGRSMSTVPLTVPASVAAAGSALRDRRRRLVAPGLGDRVIVGFAAADDVRSGMARVVAMLRRGGGAGRVEWWSPADNSSSLRLEVADGHGRGRRVAVPAGPAGVVVVVAGDHGPELSAAVRRLAPVLRRRWTEERLAQQAVELARPTRRWGTSRRWWPTS